MILAGKYPKSVEKLIIFGSNAYIVEEELKIYESKSPASINNKI